MTELPDPEPFQLGTVHDFLDKHPKWAALIASVLCTTLVGALYISTLSLTFNQKLGVLVFTFSNFAILLVLFARKLKRADEIWTAFCRKDSKETRRLICLVGGIAAVGIIGGKDASDPVFVIGVAFGIVTICLWLTQGWNLTGRES